MEREVQKVYSDCPFGVSVLYLRRWILKFNPNSLRFLVTDIHFLVWIVNLKIPTTIIVVSSVLGDRYGHPKLPVIVVKDGSTQDGILNPPTRTDGLESDQEVGRSPKRSKFYWKIVYGRYGFDRSVKDNERCLEGLSYQYRPFRPITVCLIELTSF